MARTMHGADEVYRAVVTFDYPATEAYEYYGRTILAREAFSSTTYYGPFHKAATAKARITRVTSRLAKGVTATSRVEGSSIVWETVDE